MKYSIYTLLVVALLLSACAPKADTPTSSETPSIPEPSDYAPHPSDDKLTRTPVYVDSTDLLTLESFPLQFTLSMKGNLPTPCNQLRVAVARPDRDNRIEVEVYSVVGSNTICAEMLQPFEVNVPLGSFPAGHYTLLVNDKQVAKFVT